ncbi:MAG: hypothetical protein ACJ8R9_24335 [Steroidobacteraceae bacterium]
MSKQGDMKGGSARAALRWFRRFRRDEFPMLSPDEFAHQARSPVQPEHVAQSQQAKRIWRNLNTVMRGTSRPPAAEIEADEYDGSVSVSQWLARNSHKSDGCHGGQSVDTNPLTFCAGCFSASLASEDGE